MTVGVAFTALYLPCTTIILAVLVIGYEARLLQKWSHTHTGYFLGTLTFGILLHVYPRRTQIFQKKKIVFFYLFIFFLMSQK